MPYRQGVRVAGNVAPLIFRLHAASYLAGMAVRSFGVASGVIRYTANPLLEVRIPDGLSARIDIAQDSIEAGLLVPVPSFGEASGE